MEKIFCPKCRTNRIEEVLDETTKEYSYLCLECGFQSRKTLIQAEAIILFLNDHLITIKENAIKEEINEIQRELKDQEYQMEELEESLYNLEIELNDAKKRLKDVYPHFLVPNIASPNQVNILEHV